MSETGKKLFPRKTSTYEMGTMVGNNLNNGTELFFFKLRVMPMKPF